MSLGAVQTKITIVAITNNSQRWIQPNWSVAKDVTGFDDNLIPLYQHFLLESLLVSYWIKNTGPL